jgi:PPP family 3-phenylpropionic acid transporter
MADRMPDMPEALVSAARAVKYPSARIIFYYVAMFGTVGVLGPFLPVWLNSRSVEPQEIGIIMAALSWTRVLVNPLAAHVADTTGRRKRLALLAASGACFGFATLTQAYGFWGVLAVLTFTAACQGPVLPVGENLCLLTIRARGLEYGRLRSWGSVAFIAVVTAAGYWLETAPADHIIYMLIAGWLLILFAVFFLPDLRSPPRSAAERGFSKAPAWTLLRNRSFQLLLFAAAANMSAHAALNSFSSIHWLAAGISESEIGYLWSIGVIAEVILFWASAPIVRKLGPGWLIALGAVGGIIRWIGLGLTVDFWSLMAFQSLHGLTFGAAHLGAMTYLQRYVPAESSATGQALYSALGMGVAMAVMQPITGWLFSIYGGGAFLAMAGLAGVGLCFAILLARRLSLENPWP